MSAPRTAHYTPALGHIRIYEDGGSYAARSPYICVLTVQWLADDEVFISAAHGKLDTKAIETELLRLGVKKAHYERAGKKRVRKPRCSQSK